MKGCKQTPIAIRNQNGFCERFNKTFREDVLNAYWFNISNRQ
ncbi:integrase core domain-containing protein [Moheibacter sp.]